MFSLNSVWLFRSGLLAFLLFLNARGQTVSQGRGSLTRASFQLTQRHRFAPVIKGRRGGLRHLVRQSVIIDPPTKSKSPPRSPPKKPTAEDLRLADKRDGTFLISPTTAKAHLRAWQLEPVADWVLDENEVMLQWSDTVKFPYVRYWSYEEFSERFILGTFVDGSLKAMIQIEIETAEYWAASKKFVLKHVLVSPDQYPVAAIPTLKEIKSWSDRFRWPVDFSLLETTYGGMLANLKDLGVIGDDESFNYWLEQCGECN